MKMQELALRARRAHLPTAGLLAFAGLLMIVPPAAGVVPGAQPSDLEVGFDVSVDGTDRGAGGAVASYGTSGVGALEPDGAAEGFSRLRLDPLASLDPTAAPLALTPKLTLTPPREYGFTKSRAGIRWRFSLVEGAGSAM